MTKLYFDVCNRLRWFLHVHLSCDAVQMQRSIPFRNEINFYTGFGIVANPLFNKIHKLIIKVGIFFTPVRHYSIGSMLSVWIYMQITTLIDRYSIKD